MSSWSATAYPQPTRRSRSRSPFRSNPGPPYNHAAQWPDYPHPPDAYRSEWDAYDRDRDRAGFERDRPSYDYNRRRSRSPGPDEGRKRRRSPSPYDRDRYEPRPRYVDDYDAHSRGYGRVSPQRGYGGSRRAPPDPHTFEYPASLKQYADWFRYFFPQQAIEEDNADKAAEAEAGDGSKPRNGIKARWEKYKKEFAANQLQTMFDHHRKSPWFAEKYDPAPEYAYLRRRLRKEGWKGRMAAFVLALDNGQYDPTTREDTPELVTVVQDEPMKEEKDEPKEVKPEPPTEHDENSGMAPGDESMKVEEDTVMDADEDGDKPETNGKTEDAKGKDRVEEISVEPEGNQVMIRTIPPDIGRIKLETVGNFKTLPGFVHLSLGDPLQKRNFYRAGWLRFREDADMAVVMKELNDKKIEGFKLHVIHNTTPFKNKVRYTPDVASRPDRIEKDLANVRVLAGILETEYFNVRRLPDRPEEPPADWEKGVIESEMLVDEVTDPEDPDPKERGSEAVEHRIEKLVEDLREAGKLDPTDEREYALKKNTLSLDLYLAYLRAAFHTCYYCAIVTDHLEEFQRKCIHHVRKPLSKAMIEELRASEAKEREVADQDAEVKEKKENTKDKALEGRDWKRNDERWVEWLDSKIALLINRDGVDPREYGGKSYEDELSRVAEPLIKQEDEGKFRCKTCQKLFKAVTFVEKHIANKHPESLKGLDDISYFNNFALDPHHIQPLSHPPNQISATQQPPPQAYGLPGPIAYPGPPNDYPRGGGGGGGQFYPPYNHYGAPAPYPPPPGYWPEPYGFNAYPQAQYPSSKRLGDRIGGFASGPYEPGDQLSAPASAGLPPKPTTGFTDDEARGRMRRRGTGARGEGAPGGGAAPPPPPDAKEDPRAASGKKLSYHDMDSVAEGDVELQY